MSKLLEQILSLSKDLSRLFLPPLLHLLNQLLDAKAYLISWVAHYSRRFGFRAILSVGVASTGYAIYMFLAQTLAPDSPVASHDVILRTRLSSPLPAKDIVILDIDERSLAALANTHGRWPWSREVLADGLQKLSNAGARAVLFNVLMSDPDKNNPDADAVMELTAQVVHPIAFPMVRLNPENDHRSNLQVNSIPSMQALKGFNGSTTLAAILPLFPTMQSRMGVANQLPDKDGIVRKYPFRWKESTYTLPSIVSQTLEVGQWPSAQTPPKLSLNWRNKKGHYRRISFSDFLLSETQAVDRLSLQGAFVVLGVSAPGLGQTKSTPVAAVEDDNEILATALDDALHQTYLRLMPAWLVLLINIATIWGLVWVSMRQVSHQVLNKLFVGLQSGLGCITLVSVSYTPYLIDLSGSMSFGLGVFAAIKLIQSMDDRWSRARPGFRKVAHPKGPGNLLVLAYLNTQLGNRLSLKLQQDIETIVGLAHVIRVDDLFGGESFIKSYCKDFRSLLIYVEPVQLGSIKELLSQASLAPVNVRFHELHSDWNPNHEDFVREVAPLVIGSSAYILA